MNYLRVIFAIAVLFFTVLLVPAVSAEDAATLYNARCAVCHGGLGRADTPMGRKGNIPSFASDRVRKQSPAALEDFILNGGNEKKASHTFTRKGLSQEDGARLATYVKELGNRK